jgi:hypothetical protein
VHEAADRLVHALLALVLGQALARRRHVQAQALARLQPAFGSELGVGLGHRVRVDRQLRGQAAHAGQLRARGQFAGGHGPAHAVDDLLADRARIAGGDLEHQGLGTGHGTVLCVLGVLVQ